MADVGASSEHGRSREEERSFSESQKFNVFADLSELFRGLRMASDVTVNDSSVSSNDAPLPVTNEDLNLTVATKRFCTSCELEFEGRQEQVSHFGSDWHRFNLKRKITRGLSPVTREKFEEMADDLSSISGSDSTPDSDSDADRSLDDSYLEEVTSHRLPLVYFRNDDGDLLSMYRCTLVDKKNRDSDLSTLAPHVGDCQNWAVLMVGGGHFAAAVFNKNEPIVHKTFHRYTVRAKRGTSQGMHDQKGSYAKSAGASLRRYNESQLIQNVQDLLHSWKEQLDLCSHVFLRAPSYNKTIFFSHKNPPFSKSDDRIRMIPFPTRRPTMNEVKRVHLLLSTITNYGRDSSLADVRSPQRKPQPPEMEKPLKTESKVKVKVREKVQKGQSLPYENESDSESDGEIEFIMRKEILTTGHLQDFETVVEKPKRKKRKPKPKVESKPVEGATEVPRKVIEEPNLTDEEKKYHDDVYTACKTGNQKLLSSLLARHHSNDLHDDRDNDLHGDQEHGNVPDNFDDLPLVKESELFGEAGCYATSNKLPDKMLSLRFGAKKETMLHVTSRADRPEMTYYLLENGADPSFKDSVGMVPYSVCQSKSVRNEFRRFMAAYPDRYDYVTAQIPAPLTEEMENQRKMKENERKKMAKKAKKERQKEQKERDAILEAEKREKDRYARLSDREKRALAAERRFVNQVATSGGVAPVLSRCWQCGEDITGKVPFEYFDFKFCSTKCLKLHRNQNSAPR